MKVWNFSTLNWEGATPDPWHKQRALRGEPIILCAKLSLVSPYQANRNQDAWKECVLGLWTIIGGMIVISSSEVITI